MNKIKNWNLSRKIKIKNQLQNFFGDYVIKLYLIVNIFEVSFTLISLRNFIEILLKMLLHL